MKELTTWTEAQLQRHILNVADLLGYLVYHTHDSRKSRKGFPDLVLLKPPRIIFAELKNMTYEATAEQKLWLLLLGKVPGIEVYLWRPTDVPLIERTLGLKRAPDTNKEREVA